MIAQIHVITTGVVADEVVLNGQVLGQGLAIAHAIVNFNGFASCVDDPIIVNVDITAGVMAIDTAAGSVNL